MFTDDGSDDSSGLDELRRLIARREIDTITTWRADCLSPALRDELEAAQCSLYSHRPAAPPPAAAPECSIIQEIARAKAEGKHCGRPYVSAETERAVCALLGPCWLKAAAFVRPPAR